MKKHFFFYIFICLKSLVFSQEYTNVIIGNQIWMTENLNIQYFSNGDLIPEARTIEEWNLALQNKAPAWCKYKNDITNEKKYGKLYNYFAVNSTKGIAPKGWHVPTQQEWVALAEFIKNEGGGRSSLASSAGWMVTNGYNGNGNNTYGFSALPSGFRNDETSTTFFRSIWPDGFCGEGDYAYWWSSTEKDDHSAFHTGIVSNDDLIILSNFSSKGSGNAVRLIKDDENLHNVPSAFLSTNESLKTKQNNNTEAPNTSDSKKKKSLFGSRSFVDGKFKVVRVKERDSGNNYPIIVDVYDKSLSLKVGDNIIITRTDEVQIPGEKKTIKSETTIGKAKITEDFNKPLYTAKLIANAGFNMKDYKDGDENYSAVKGEENKTIIASPKIMVIPKKIDPSKYVNGEYLLSKEEKMLIAAFKNKFEGNRFTTYGFESSLKSVFENRQFNDNVQDDIKSKILESSGMDFFVEYENLDQNNTKCDKVFDFKIRNYSTGEDLASDVKSLNSCGSPEDYKSFASAILNAGAISKINTQFSSLLNNGRKVSVIFTIANFSQATFNKEYNGTKLKDHIENCLQGLAFNGNLDIEGVVNLRMETSVNIPIINENTGKSYTTNTFSEDIIGYLKKNANVECESSVSKQIVNIKIK